MVQFMKKARRLTDQWKDKGLSVYIRFLNKEENKQ